MTTSYYAAIRAAHIPAFERFFRYLQMAQRFAEFRAAADVTISRMFH